MSEQARFQEWWESTGTNSVILRAQAWSAWLARAEADQPLPAEDPDKWVEITDPMHMLRRDVDFTNTRHDTWEPICFWHGQFIGKLHEWGYTDSRFRCRRRDLPKVEQKKTTDDFGMYLESVIAKDTQLKAEVDAAEAELAAIDARLNEQAEQWPKYYKIEDMDIAYMIRLSPTELKYVYKRGHEGTVWRWSEEDEAEHRTEITEAEAMALLKPTSNADWSYHEKQKPQPQKRMLRLWVDSDCNIHAGLKGDLDLELHYDHETRQFYTEEQP